MSTNTKPEKLECKVKIGSAYEPRWFERRQTNGWYSGKNAPLDRDAMGLQSALLSGDGFKDNTHSILSVCTVLCVLVLCAWVIWAMFM